MLLVLSPHVFLKNLVFLANPGLPLLPGQSLSFNHHTTGWKWYRGSRSSAIYGYSLYFIKALRRVGKRQFVPLASVAGNAEEYWRRGVRTGRITLDFRSSGCREFRRRPARLSLQLGGVDLLDGTPVIDIKPYVPYCDCPAGASDGWLEEDFPVVQIDFLPDPAAFCQDYESKTKRHLTALIQQVLQLDPRPASQRGRRSAFGMMLWDVNIRWLVDGNVYTVTACELVGVPRNK